MRRIGILTSGGDCSGMNPVIRSLVRCAHHFKVEVIGIRRGFRGLIERDFVKLSPRDVGGILDRGGTILLSARERRFFKREFREVAYKNLKEEGIEGLVVLGGEGSLTGAKVLCEEFDLSVVGIPCTIDNDVGGTDYCVGFDTAVKNAVYCIDSIRDTASSHQRVFIVEVMGRRRGFIALETALATGAEMVLVPEVKTPLERLVENLKRSREVGKMHFVVVVAEGYAPAHRIYEELLKRVGERFGEVRYTVLGHVQRGGAPTPRDRIMGSLFGEIALEFLLSKERGFVAYRRGMFYLEDFEKVKEEKPLPMDYLRLLERTSL